MRRLLFVIVLAVIPGLARAQAGKTGVDARVESAQRGACTVGNAHQDLYANNVVARLYNTGGLFWKGSGNLYEVPAWGSANAVFASGIWMGGMVGGELRFAGTDYGPFEFFPGPLDESGDPPANCGAFDRIYSVSEYDLRDYEAGRPHTSDIEEWPWHLGAPVVDGDGNPDNYNLAGGDRPQVLGHQTAWWVMNDAAGEHVWSKTPPLGLEVQVTAFAVSTDDALDNTTFYRYRFTYRGEQPLKEGWIGFWSDPDLGNAADDFVGYDSTLQMGYVYNGDDFDDGSTGYGASPPALGFVLLEGLLVSDDGIDNDRDGQIDESEESLGVEKFVQYLSDTTPQAEPVNGREAYGYLRGLWRDGTPITFGGTGYGGTKPADYMYPGDPVTRSYWSAENVDGSGRRNVPADRRSLLSMGPFTMNTGDSKEMVIAIVWSRGEDRLDSVRKLREDAAFVREAFRSGSIDGYSAPAAPRGPSIDVSPAEIAVKLGPGETTTHQLIITNNGTAELEWAAGGFPRPGISRILTVANVAGPLDPPDMGTFSLNDNGYPTVDGRPPHCSSASTIDYRRCNDRPTHEQQIGPGRFGIQMEQATTSSERFGFQSGIQHLGDYEWRFTGTSTAAHVGAGPASVEVPFELWNIGVNTPTDASDDFRMIPVVWESRFGGTDSLVFDLGGDHPVSDGENDPASDVVDWYNPVDTTPGESGYHAFLNGGNVDGTQRGEHVFSDQVLVSLDGGTAPPYSQSLPEEGTIFRIETEKPWIVYDGKGTGRLSEGQTVIEQLEFGRFEREPGVYRDTLIITSRDPRNPLVRIPVTLEVTRWPSIETPAAHLLEANYPNPFAASTLITFALPEDLRVHLAVYDTMGRRVRVLVDEWRAAGWHGVPFDASDLGSGMYVYRLETGEFQQTRTMLHVR